MRQGKVTLSVVIFLILCSPYCKKEKWDGSIFEDSGVIVIENRGPGLWGAESKEKIHFIEEISLGIEEGEDYLMFFRLRDMAVDSDRNIYILDGGNHRLLNFDTDGKFVWQAGREGQGPGEFQHPAKVVMTYDGKIAVLDESIIHFFDKSGKFQSSIRTEKSFRDITFLPDGRLFVNIFLRGQPGVAAEYLSAEGKFLNKFMDEYRYGPKISPRVGASIGGGYYKIIGNRVYLSIPDQYEIREYNMDGKVLRKIKRDVKLKPPNIIVSQGGGGVSVYPSDNSGPCFLYKNEFIVNCFTLVEKIGEAKFKSESFLDFFNNKGQFLGSYTMPEAYRLNTIDSDDKFYFIQWNPIPRVIRAKIEIK